MLKKEYKTFSFPNEFSELEQYFFYLKEFEVIPKNIHSQTVEEIFLNASRDLLNDSIDFTTYSLVVENLYINYVAIAIGMNIDRKIEKLMERIAEDESLKEEEVTMELQDLLKNLTVSG